jgi:type IV pilus assembly protein PilQ
MYKRNFILALIIASILAFGATRVFSQDQEKKQLPEEAHGMLVQDARAPIAISGTEEAPAAVTMENEGMVAEQAKTEPVEKQEAVIDDLAASRNVTLDFKEADIRNVLKIISYKSGVNIVTTPEVIGNVTIRLVDVPWEKALDVILRTYGFGYEKQANIITVAPIEKLTVLKKQEVELAQVQPTVTEVFNLKYIDAQDAKKALDPQLSSRGKITVLEMTGQAGWEFGGSELGKRKRASEDKLSRSKILIVSDIPPIMDKLKEVIDKIDIKPKQVLIQTKVVEINRDKLKDIGLDLGTGSAGASSYATAPEDIGVNKGNTRTVAGRNLASEFTPTVFGPTEGTTTFPGTYPYKAGLELIFKKLTGYEFEAILHAVEETSGSNVLSSPSIVTLNNQEASILVGTRYPILKTEISGTETATTQVTLDYYQDIGIQLNVVPQVGANDDINMVIHPAVTDYTSTLGTNAYPIIDTREAETRILMRDGETIVIGGLLKDVKKKQILSVPFLNKIPLLGLLFKRETIDTQKIDLLIFITVRVIRDIDFSVENISKYEERVGLTPEGIGYPDPENKKKNKKR